MRMVFSKIFYGFLSLAMLLGVSSITTVTASAAEVTTAKSDVANTTLGSSKSKEYYYDEETGDIITDLYTVTENGLKKISFEEFKAHRKLEKEMANASTKQISPISQQNTISALAITNYFYKQSTASQIYGGSYAVSNPLSCSSGAVNCSANIQWSSTQTATYSANVTSEAIKSAIKIGASFSWANSASVSNTYALTVPPGKTGQIMFRPLFNSTTGMLDIYSNGYKIASQVTSAKSPVKLQTGALAGDVWTRVY